MVKSVERRLHKRAQWKEINPHVEPVGFNERQNGSLEVEVHQKVKDLQGNLMFDVMVKPQSGASMQGWQCVRRTCGLLP